MIEKLLKTAKRIAPGLELSAEDLLSNVKHKQVKKGDQILKAGSTCSHYYFVVNGAFRIYFLHNENEISNWFAFEDFFFTELESYTFQKPSKFYIEAIEESDILTITRSNMEDLLSKHPSWQEYLRKNWEYTFIKLVNVIASFQSKPAKERYDELFDFPDFIQRTKQKDLSSMIGITHHSLSRLRKPKK